LVLLLRAILHPCASFLAHFRVSRCRSSSRVFTLATAVFGLLLRFLGLSSPSACAHRLSLPLLSLASKSLRRSFPSRTLPIGPCTLSFRSLGLALPEARFRICHCTNCTSVVPGICAYFASAVFVISPLSPAVSTLSSPIWLLPVCLFAYRPLPFAVCLFASVAAAALSVVRSCPVPVGLLRCRFDPLCPVFALAVSLSKPLPSCLAAFEVSFAVLASLSSRFAFSLQFSPFWTLASGLSLGSPTGHFGLLGPLIALEGSQVASWEAILPLGRRRLALF
jgi:hypothetical protein